MTGTRVLTARGPVVVGTVAGAVVVVAGAVVERVVRTIGAQAAPVSVTQHGVTLSRTTAERHGDGVAVGVASAHRLTPESSEYDAW